MGRATILGSRTAGAGNPVTLVQFDNYQMYVPICEIKTTTNKSIEGIGVIPEIKLTSDDWVKETIHYISTKND